MDFKLTEEQQLLVSTLREMGEKENFMELASKVDKTGEFPWELMSKYADLGLLGMTLSPEYGGQGQGALTAVLAIEELAKYSPMIAGPVFESNVGPVRVVDLFGTPEQREKIVRGVINGELSVSVCMTEPEAGCDLTNLSTTVIPDGDDYILNGRKVFITGGGEASHYMV
ncbi:MAG: acyl-CoA dehydrogenase family protein, partial [Candidatus Geothermincolia bacterium]